MCKYVHILRRNQQQIQSAYIPSLLWRDRQQTLADDISEQPLSLVGMLAFPSPRPTSSYRYYMSQDSLQNALSTYMHWQYVVLICVALVPLTKDYRDISRPIQLESLPGKSLDLSF
nr:hypothetical protein CFP56_62520 [Quercus suber]